MDDKTLADAVAVLLGAERGQGPTSDRWFLHRESIEQYLGFNNKELVRDPRVAMALMEKMTSNNPLTIQTADDGVWYVDLEDWEASSITRRNESLPRAIIEACCEALSNE